MDPFKVNIERMRKDINMPMSDFMWLNLVKGSLVNLLEHLSSFSKAGIHGDLTLDNCEENRFRAVVEQLLEPVYELKNPLYLERTDYHTGNPPSSDWLDCFEDRPRP